MDALILLGSFIALILIGMPVAYALGLSALIGAWWIDIPVSYTHLTLPTIYSV